MGLLQLDSVNVLARSHYLPVYSRLGPYSRDMLDRMTAHTSGAFRREYVEYWAHEASLIPLRLHPLLRWRMAQAARQAWAPLRRVARENPRLLAELRRQVRDRGPVRASELESLGAPAGRPGGQQMWARSEVKAALEFLFWSGELGAARRVNFERHYDVIERVLPSGIHNSPTPSREDAQRELMRVAARACGVATAADLADYFRLPVVDAKERIAELVSASELLPVSVQGWRSAGYLWPGSRRPREVRARALLSPFDPLIWRRERVQRLFGFRYRLEIYTPAQRRLHGYYVLPYLLGDTLRARVDLKADRRLGVLRVQSAWHEPCAAAGCHHGFGDDCDPDRVAAELAADLGELAGWLGLGAVVQSGRGTLAAALARQLR